ncbi:MAG: endo-1,4-beta-xylanase [Planctomycetes bacterium]|nr:endo-1,4-beta-xylanase [Planctomycetota bacterium]
MRACRTAEVTLTVLDAAGKPLADAAVSVRQVRHKFLFGCNIFELKPKDASPLQKGYQDRYTALLNYGTLPFYWGAFEREPGQTDTARVLAMAEWCRDHGVPTKGHPLCWHEVKPRWLGGKPLDEVERLQLGRIGREVGAFKGLIERWDVVNEAVRMPTFDPGKNEIAALCKQLGAVELIKRTFAAARQADPKAVLLLNDYDTSPAYEALVKGCLEAGVPIDVIGIQSHMHGGYWGAGQAWSVCERFARFGKPLHFTELTIQSGEMKKDIRWAGPQYTDWASTPEGEKRQAEQVREFYRVLFSHPAVEAITWWDFSDHGAWLGSPSGLVRKDMSPKPAYETLLKMVKGEWWTAPLTLRTDAAGRVTFRGWLGAYAVAADGAGATVEILTPGTAAATARLAAGA